MDASNHPLYLLLIKLIRIFIWSAQLFISVFNYLSHPIEFSFIRVIKKHSSVFPLFQTEGHHLMSLSLSGFTLLLPIKGRSFSSHSSLFLVPDCPLSPSSSPSQQPIERSTLASPSPLPPLPPPSFPFPSIVSIMNLFLKQSLLLLTIIQ